MLIIDPSGPDLQPAPVLTEVRLPAMVEVVDLIQNGPITICSVIWINIFWFF
jgi:hypothetical protein